MVDKLMNDNLVSSTARWTAAARALESVREDRLFNDPWAAALAGAEGMAWAENRPIDGLAPIILRIRYFDEFLQRIIREYSINQVVLMACGFDTRAFRLDWPAGTNLFELDQAGILQEKDGILHSAGARPTCIRHTIEANLTNPWMEYLTKAGFDPKQPSIWLLEGFLFYLSSETIKRILGEVNSLSFPGSWLGFDIINTITLTSPYTKQWIEMQANSGAPWIGSLDDPVGFLASLGWKAMLSQAGQPDANHGRWHLPVIPVDMAGMPHNWFVTAKKESH